MDVFLVTSRSVRRRFEELPLGKESLDELRAVATTWSPAARQMLTSSFPKPVEVPVWIRLC